MFKQFIQVRLELLAPIIWAPCPFTSLEAIALNPILISTSYLNKSINISRVSNMNTQNFMYCQSMTKACHDRLGGSHELLLLDYCTVYDAIVPVALQCHNCPKVVYNWRVRWSHLRRHVGVAEASVITSRGFNSTTSVCPIYNLSSFPSIPSPCPIIPLGSTHLSSPTRAWKSSTTRPYSPASTWLPSRDLWT